MPISISNVMLFSKRPLGVTILALLAFGGAIACVYSLIALLSSDMALYMTTYQMRIIGITDIIMTLIALSVAYGFFKRLRWSWFLYMFTLVIVTILHVYEYLSSFWALSSYPSPGEIGMLSYIIVMYLFPVVNIAILGLISIYLTRPHVKTYFGFGQPGDISAAVKENKRKSVSTVAVLVIITGLCIWGFTPSGDITIINVTQTPENPESGDAITVIAEIAGGSPFLGVSASLYCSGRMAGTVTSVDKNKYSFTFAYPFEDGTEKWYMIRAGDKISEVYILQVGHVERSNITSLAITDVIQTPEQPATATSSVDISAKVTSNVTISEVTLEHMRFYEHGRGGGYGSMQPDGNATYEDSICTEFYESGTQVFYRISAKDESGNTAVTQVHSFTLTP
ncbi:hypothetical protein C5S35_16110 [Candidatus Methanophagaceae archaeon]|nr:hypothetical protein C5S35_16110 [Methanophagales archaeon]